jgi:two-component system chemotaxis response regulator CheB
MQPDATVIGICASTGGPGALELVLERLPADFPIPIVVVQHMTPGFTEGFVSWLDSRVAPCVRVASASQELRSGVWFAADGAHLVLDGHFRLVADPGPPVLGHKPSGDRLLGSLAKFFGARAVAVVLTGMGRDGASGLADVAAAGGRTIAQDEQSSTVYGMPRVAKQLGARQILPPAAIGEALAMLRAGVPR